MSITYSPAYPIVGDTVCLRMTRTVQSTTIDVERPEYRLTAVPPGSKLSTQDLLAAKANPRGTVLAATTNTARSFQTNLAEANDYWIDAKLTFTSGPNVGRTVLVESFANSGGIIGVAGGLVEAPNAGDTFTLEHEDKKRLSFKPDVPGTYTLTGNIYKEWQSAPAFDGDAQGQTYRILSGTESVSVYVGVVADMPVIIGDGHGITLRVKAHDGEITAAELVDPLTRRDYLATKNSTVITKLAALISTATDALGPDLAAAMNTFITKYEAHRILTAGSVHAFADATNVYVPDRPYDLKNSVESVNEMREQLLGHLTGASAAGSSWHTADDRKNVPIAPVASSLAQGMLLYADLWRCYERHRVQTASPAAHGASDGTNALSAVDQLSDLWIAYLDFIADESPTAPTGAETGEVDLTSRYGFSV